MEFNFEQVIATPTEHKAPPAFFSEPPEGKTEEIAPPAEPGQGPESPPPPRRDASFSADVAVSSLDALQYVGFFIAHKRKLKSLYFSTPEQYIQAIEHSRRTPDELAALENAEEARSLISKYKIYLGKLEARTAALAFTPEEEALLKKPLEKMIERNPNFEIPPGMGLILAGLVIASPRLIDLTQDN